VPPDSLRPISDPQSPTPNPRFDRHAILLIGLSLFSWVALITPDYFLKAHDARHSLFFLMQFHSGVADGYLLPRWGPDFTFGYGYPLFVFYSPLAFYVAEAFHLVGLSFAGAVKATFALGFVLSALSMYRLGRRVVGPEGALLAAALYTYVPYRFVDTYVRAALAESFAFVFLPLVLLTFHDLLTRPTRRRAALAALSYGALILTHNSTALIFTPIVGLYGLLLIARRSSARARATLLGWAILAGLLGLAVSAVFWLPNLAEQSNILVSQWVRDTYNYRQQFVYPGQLLSSFWGYGYSVAGPNDGMGFQIGLVPLALAMVLLAGGSRLRRRPRVEGAFFVVIGLALAVAMLPAADPLWQVFPFAPLIQFPWRLLAPLAMCVALVGGMAADALLGTGSADRQIVTVLLVTTVIAGHAFAWPQYTPPNERQETTRIFLDFEQQHLDMVGMMAWSEQQPTTSPVEEQMERGDVPVKVVALSSDAQVQQQRYGGTSLEADVSAPADTTVRILSYAYPGWKAWVDGQEASIRRAPPFGLMAVDVPAGEHRLSLRFTDTPLRKTAWAISLIALMVAGWLLSRRPVGGSAG